MAADAERELTHDELWDDSALVESWNEALEEYQKYHSLAARGEKVPINEKPTLPELPSKAAALLNGAHPAQAKPTATAKATASNEMATTIPGNFIGPVPPPSQSAPAAPLGGTGSLASLPQTLLGTTQDENLRNIMMSWYYAGYHTGLYEGQQRAWAQWQEAQQKDQQQEEGAG